MKKIFLALSIPLFLSATTLPELFEALKSHSQTKADEIVVKKSEIYKNMANSQLYPKINLFASYDNYTTPTGMIPVPPNQLVEMIQPATKYTSAQPFSKNILREGVNFSMPIFMKSIFSSAEKAEAMQKSARAKKHINMLKNEAIIVGANANFLYLEALMESLLSKEKSLTETQKTLKIKVDNGRSPASALYKINDGLNQIDIAKNNIELQKQIIRSTIESLTGVSLKRPIKMQESLGLQKGELASLRPLQEKIKADRLGIKLEKEKLYPALFAHGSYVYSQGEAYNSGKRVNTDYGNIGVMLNIPLLAMDKYSTISLSEVEVRAGEIELAKTTDELTAQAKMLENSLPLLENSKKLYIHSIADKKKLLGIAKVNYMSGRLSTEEYLRYEDDVVSEKANLYKTEATKWQTLMQLAVIYANNIEEMVK